MDTALALVPARDEAERIAATVQALRSIPGVAEVVVVDDGSTDATAARALAAGASCLQLSANRGKGGALAAGITSLRARVADGTSAQPFALLIADADLEASAAALGGLLAPVFAGEADLAIADLPPQPGAGGFGIVMRLGRWGTRRASGVGLAEPLSGQRALRWDVVDAVLPLGGGFGVDLAMTLDAIAARLRVTEIPLELWHRSTGRDVAGTLHRLGQARDVVRVLLRRQVVWR